jgi:hypothetical protein
VDRGREWVRKGRKSSLEGKQWIFLHRRKRESEGHDSRDEKMMIVMLIV